MEYTIGIDKDHIVINFSGGILMENALWGLTIIGSILGGIFIVLVVTGARGAPQEAAGAAIGISMAVIPYCLARALSEVRQG